MATVTQLADRVSNTAGLATGTSTTERTLIIQYLNEAYQRAVADTGNYTSSVTWTLTSGTSTYTIGTAPTATTDILQILNVTTTSGGATNQPVRLTTEAEIRQLLDGGTGAGVIEAYALVGTNKIVFAPIPGTATVTVTYVAAPPTLVESGPAAGEESTPTAFPALWHYPLIAGLATSMAYDFRGNRELSDHHMARYQESLVRFQGWAARFAGDNPPPVFDASLSHGYSLDADVGIR